ncbi:hypothetical protein TUN199_00902 [Pyrenophora tritici-repentis]|nr:hypothetical protein PtrV1_07998 [Pyrenophora tritici-repentis]KAF7449043.1 hypothetical protein A1F99_060920 [Pyrenophora tritici-repentis]KAI0585116.1 hypothetical protein Alg215_02672 [Pyrenophora tritici-repentis]KAI0614005.1 hypothetical protein TUN205_01704 [Pyrenophora tritici-repentis]KAI0627033.1 hypothetical protein TUN199_00902 [Pyrenophora tritici-repentis]
MTRTRPRKKRALDDDDDAQSSRPNDRANTGSYRPQPFVYSSDHLSLSLPLRPAAGLPYVPPIAFTHTTAASVPYNPPAESSRKSATGPPRKLASVYQLPSEADAVEDSDGEIRWRVPNSAAVRKETFASSSHQGQMPGQSWEGDINKDRKSKKQGLMNVDSKNKKWGSMNEESKDNKERWVAKSSPRPPPVMFTVSEAFAALKHGPKPVLYELPDGKRLSYSTIGSYHLGAMRYGADGTPVENPAHKDHLAFKPTSWHDIRRDPTDDSRYGG